MLKDVKRNKGITLIALVVTIIVIIILAGVTIAALSSSGIIGRANEAKDKTEQASAEEEVQMSWMNLYTANTDFDSLTLERQSQLLEEDLKNQYPDANSEIKELNDDDKTIKVNHRGYDVTVSSSGTGNNSTGGNTSGGGTTGGNTSSGGNASGGGNTSGGGNKPSGGNTSTGNTSTGGNTSGGGSSEDTKVTYVVTFNSKGGSDVSSQTVKKGSKATRPSDPTRSGFTFSGWYLDEGLTNLYNFNSSINENITLYAKWTNETGKDNFEWVTTSKYATLLGFSDTGKAAYNNGEITELTIPSVYNGLQVSKINTSAFSGCNKLTKLVIPDGVDTILDNAFQNCSGIKDISLPISINYMSNSGVFSGCSGITKVSLTAGNGDGIGYDYLNNTYQYTPWYYSRNNSIEVTIKSNVKNVGRYTFYQNAGIKKVTIEDGAENSGIAAFYGCTGLKIVELGCKNVSDTSFYGCTNLQSVVLRDSVENVGNSSFSNCTGLLVLTIGNGLKNIGNEAFKSCASLEVDYDNPNIETIGNSAFYECKGMKGSLDFAKNVVSIGNSAFYNCTGITGFSFTKILNIGDSAFSGCSYLTSGVESLSTVETIGSSAFNGCNNLKGTISLNKVRSIGSGAFSGRTGIVGSIETENIESVGSSAFFGCTGITKVVLKGSSDATLSGLAFYGCSGLTEVEIGDNVKKLDGPVFSNCTGLKKLKIPISLDAVGYNSSYSSSYGYTAFNGDKNITEMTFSKGTGVGYDYSQSSSTPWRYAKESLTKVTLEDGIISIGENMFSDCTALINLTLPSTVKTVKNSAFSGCSNIESEIDLSNITSIGTAAFYNCQKMKGNWNLSQELTEIPNQTFYNCSARSGNISLDNITSIGSKAFYNCSNLTGTIKINNVEMLYNWTFYQCTSIEKVELGGKVKTLEGPVFFKCSNLKEVIIGENVTKLDGPVFAGCIGITKLEIPISLDSVGYNSKYDYSSYNYQKTAFGGDTNITEITFTKGTGEGYSYEFYPGYTPWYNSKANTIKVIIGEGIESIGKDMFIECTGLTTLILPSTVKTIKDSAFYKCSNIESEIDLSNINSIGTSAFYNCQKMKGNWNLSTELTEIPNQAFYNCSARRGDINLENITLIGESAFYNCSNLTGTIKINSVEMLYNWTFYQCTSIEKVELGGKVKTLEGPVFFKCSNLKEVIIGENVTKLDGPVFAGCIGITKLEIPISLDSVGYNSKYDYSSYNYQKTAFGEDTNITEIIFTKGTGEGYSYESYSNYTPWCNSRNNVITVVIGEGINSIGKYMFSGCTGLTTLTLPNTVKTIKDSAFYNCSNIESEVDLSNITSIGTSALYNCSKMKGDWNLSKEITQIPYSAFYGCSARTGELDLSDVTTIGESAFYGCTGITGKINLSKIQEITSYALYNCSNINDIEISDLAKSIVYSSFEYCTSVTKLKMPISLNVAAKSSYDYTFRDITKLTEVTFTKGTGTAYNYQSSYSYTPWYNSKDNNITVTFEEGIDDIGAGTFNGTTGLKYINIAKSISKIGDNAFNGCSNIRIVNYAGTSSKWKTIQFGTGNQTLTGIKTATLITNNNGTCNTGITLSGNYKIETKIKPLQNSNSYNYIYGTGSSNFETYIALNDSKLHFTSNNKTTASNVTLKNNTSYTITEEVKDGTMTASVDGVECINETATEGTSGEVDLFASANGNCSGSFEVEYFKIYKDGELVLDLIPIITRKEYDGQTSEKQGFYDKIGKQFLYSNNKEFGLEGGVLNCNEN